MLCLLHASTPPFGASFSLAPTRQVPLHSQRAHLHQSAVADAGAVVQDQGGELVAQLQPRGRAGAAAGPAAGVERGPPAQKARLAGRALQKAKPSPGSVQGEAAGVKAARRKWEAHLGDRHQAIIAHARATQQAEAAQAAAVLRHRPQTCTRMRVGGGGAGARAPARPACKPAADRQGVEQRPASHTRAQAASLSLAEGHVHLTCIVDVIQIKGGVRGKHHLLPAPVACMSARVCMERRPGTR